MAEITVSSGPIRGSIADGELVVRMIDEIPAVCALAAVSKGRTEIRDAAELRVKESDRIATMAQVLGAFGVPCEELPDGLIITGGASLHGAQIDSRGDHRIAMSAALLGLLADGESLIDGAEAVDTSFPGFVALLRSLGANITEEAL
jgi:3-phosphoshikimate 1-carboxyvinyltransferase